MKRDWRLSLVFLTTLHWYSVSSLLLFGGNACSQGIFALRHDTAISFVNFLYGVFYKSHLVRSLTVHMRLPT